jgi:hypothetical protein
MTAPLAKVVSRYSSIEGEFAFMADCQSGGCDHCNLLGTCCECI